MNQQGVQINVDTLEDVECVKCSSPMFQKVYILKKLSALNPANPSGRDQIVQVENIVCAACGFPLGGIPEPNTSDTEQSSIIR